MDLVVRSPRFALAGETILGHAFFTIPGGKGANQAVAFPIADLAVMAENARNLTYKAAWLKDRGITTVAFWGDPLTPIFFTQEATRQRYLPEWIVTGSLATHREAVGQSIDGRPVNRCSLRTSGPNRSARHVPAVRRATKTPMPAPFLAR